MKNILIIISLIGVFLIGGCSENFDWQTFSQRLNTYSQQQQNLNYQQNMQLRENAREINRQLQHSEQEEYYRRLNLRSSPRIVR